MEHYILLGILVLCIGEPSCAGPKCFNCQRRPKARDCDHVTTCGDHEVCNVKQLVSKSGFIYYDVGCLDRQRCQTKRTVDGLNTQEEENGDIVTCTSCCHGDLCNTGGCGSEPISELTLGSRGPICFSCPHGQITPEQCDKVTICGRDQSCSIRPVTGFGGDHLSASGCTSSCSTGTVLVGKRETSTCDGCCHGDFCNMNCTGIQAANGILPVSTSDVVTPTKPLSTLFTPSVTPLQTSVTSHPLDYEKLCLLMGYRYLSQFSHCYKIYSGMTVTWKEACARCNNDNADLLILHNKDEEQLFESLTETPTGDWDTKRYWIGASDIEQEARWVWVDRTPINPRYFYPTEPNNGGSKVDENCGALSFINKTFLLNDDVCDNNYHFICEINMKNPSFMINNTQRYCRNNHYTYDNNNGICYKVYDVKTTMRDARLACQKESADLLQFRTVNVENVFLHSGILDPSDQDTRYWLGATRHDDGQFYWLNGHQRSLENYQWAKGEPNNYLNRENCVDLANLGTFALNDDDCDKQNHFICEERCPNPEFIFVPNLNLCIKVFVQHVTWKQAMDECQRQHSDLAEPDTLDKILLLRWFLDNFALDRYWVGARRFGSNNSIRWQVNNTSVTDTLWTDSTSGTNISDGCVVLQRTDSPGKKWLHLVNCSTGNIGFICQYSM